MSETGLAVFQVGCELKASPPPVLVSHAHSRVQWHRVRCGCLQPGEAPLKARLPRVRPAASGLCMQWTVGTTAGLKHLVDFLEKGLPGFDHDRAKIDRASTSQLSPYIHYGELSVRAAARACRGAACLRCCTAFA